MPVERPQGVQGSRQEPTHLIVGRRAGSPRVATLTAVQSHVLDLVLERPGCSIQHIALGLRVSHATAAYHLYALSRLGQLVQVRDGREVRHFAGPAAPGSLAYLLALARDGRKAKLLGVLASEGSEAMTIHQMAQASGLSFSFIKRTLQQLEWAGLARLERRRYRYVVRVDAATRQQLEELFPPAANPWPTPADAPR